MEENEVTIPDFDEAVTDGEVGDTSDFTFWNVGLGKMMRLSYLNLKIFILAYIETYISSAIVKTKYEANADTNVFTDAEKTKVGHISVTQAVDLDAIEADLNNAVNTLAGIGAIVSLKGSWDASVGTFPGGGVADAGWSYIITADGTVDGVVFKSGDRIIALSDNASTTVYAGNWYKADYTDVYQTDSEIETAYNNQVSTVLQAEAEAGTATTVRRWTAERVKQAILALAPKTGSGFPFELIVAISDETTNLTTGTSKSAIRMPFAGTITEVRLGLNVAGTGGTKVTIDINKNGTTILSTKLTTDASETTSVTAAVPPVISVPAFINDDRFTFDIDAVGSTTPGQGAKVLIKGTRS